MLDGSGCSIDWVRNCWYWLAARTLWHQGCDRPCAGCLAPRRLAADLELWFERYRVQWLSIGRYAELARIAHVVWSFADILRRGAL